MNRITFASAPSKPAWPRGGWLAAGSVSGAALLCLAGRAVTLMIAVALGG